VKFVGRGQPLTRTGLKNALAILGLGVNDAAYIWTAPRGFQPAKSSTDRLIRPCVKKLRSALAGNDRGRQSFRSRDTVVTARLFCE
jgi:hypothetical protein